MTTGAELTTFITGLNGGATIDPTLLASLVDNGRAILEEERPWMVLRKTDTSLSLTTANTWQTAKAISGITDFSRFYGDGCIKLYDSSTDRIHYYFQKPFDRRLEYKNDNTTFVFDENGGNLYFNGTPPFAGTLYIPYICTSTAVDLASASAQWTLFPSRFLPILGYYAIGIHKGAVDYDSINKQMLPSNAAALASLKNAMENWDNARQQSAIEQSDPTELHDVPRAGAVNRYAA